MNVILIILLISNFIIFIIFLFYFLECTSKGHQISKLYWSNVSQFILYHNKWHIDDKVTKMCVLVINVW